MIQKYKLKKDARKFFKEDYSTKAMPLENWEKECIGLPLLDELDSVAVYFGHKTSENSSSLSGWSGLEGEAHFLFTVKVSDMTHEEYEKVPVCNVIDEIQKVLNRYFKSR